MAKGQKTGGRQKGTPNKATAEISELAKAYVPNAIKELGRLAMHAKSEAARISAIGLLFDRAYGRPRQAMELTGKDGGPIEHAHTGARDEVERRIAQLAARARPQEGAGKPH